MKSCMLLLILLVPTAATPLTRVKQWHYQKFSASGCNAADKVEDDYKELDVCNQRDATTWEMAVGTATTYTKNQYTDSACTTEKVPNGRETRNAACTSRGGIPEQWEAGSVATMLDTYRATGPYTDNACTTLDGLSGMGPVFGAQYHAMNTCQTTSASSSIKYVCTATTIQKQVYTTKDCSGTVDATCGGQAADCNVLTSGDVCTAYPAGDANAGKFQKRNCGPISGSTSKAWRVCSHGLVQLLVGAALAAVMSF